MDFRKYPFHVQWEPFAETGETPLAYVAERSGVVREHRNRKKIALLHSMGLPAQDEHRILDGRKGFGLVRGDGMEKTRGRTMRPRVPSGNERSTGIRSAPSDTPG